MGYRVSRHVVRMHARRRKGLHASEVSLDDILAADLEDAKTEIQSLRAQLEAERGIIESVEQQMRLVGAANVHWDGILKDFHVWCQGNHLAGPCATLREALAAAAEAGTGGEG